MNEAMNVTSWKKRIRGIKKQVEETTDRALLKERFEEAFVNAVKKGLTRNFGILFSGGVDSSFIAFVSKRLGADFCCYAVGLEGSRDIESAEKAALMLGLKLKTRVFSLEEAKEIIEKVANILNEPNPVQVGIGSVGYAASELAKKDSVEVLFSGLGSENLFVGYERLIKAKDINAGCWRSLENVWEQDLRRDTLIENALKVRFFAPFLDEKVICAAMSVPSHFKVGISKKPFLREIAVGLGLPKELALKKRAAAQYSSGFDKALQKIAKLQGFKYKKDYLKSVLKLG